MHCTRTVMGFGEISEKETSQTAKTVPQARPLEFPVRRENGRRRFGCWGRTRGSRSNGEVAAASLETAAMRPTVETGVVGKTRRRQRVVAVEGQRKTTWFFFPRKTVTGRSARRALHAASAITLHCDECTECRSGVRSGLTERLVARSSRVGRRRYEGCWVGRRGGRTARERAAHSGEPASATTGDVQRPPRSVRAQSIGGCRDLLRATGLAPADDGPAARP